MLKTETDIIWAAIQEKIELAERIETQMQPHIAANKLSGKTIQAVLMAKDNLCAAEIHLGSNDLEKCLYFLMRGSWNLGQCIAYGAADKEKAENVEEETQ